MNKKITMAGTAVMIFGIITIYYSAQRENFFYKAAYEPAGGGPGPNHEAECSKLFSIDYNADLASQHGYFSQSCANEIKHEIQDLCNQATASNMTTPELIKLVCDKAIKLSVREDYHYKNAARLGFGIAFILLGAGMACYGLSSSNAIRSDFEESLTEAQHTSGSTANTITIKVDSAPYKTPCTNPHHMFEHKGKNAQPSTHTPYDNGPSLCGKPSAAAIS